MAYNIGIYKKPGRGNNYHHFSIINHQFRSTQKHRTLDKYYSTNSLWHLSACYTDIFVLEISYT